MQKANAFYKSKNSLAATRLYSLAIEIIFTHHLVVFVFYLIYTFISSHVSFVQANTFKSFTIAILKFKLTIDQSWLCFAYNHRKI